MSGRGSIVFSAQNLQKIYRTGEVEVHALRGVNLELYESEVVVFLGPSGSGKSTILNILGGLDQPSSGKVFYREHDLVHSSEKELTRFRREHVGFVFQFYNLIPTLTAIENIALVAELSTNSMDPMSILGWVGMESRAHHFPSQLSGGEQQRVAIARAVIKKPDILLCDEPTGALDYETGKRVLEAILRVNRELGTLVAIITHNAAIAAIADRVIRVANGGIQNIHVNECRKSIEEVEW